MFMSLGPCRFKVNTIPVNAVDRTSDYRLASMPVGQSAPSQQFLGQGEEIVTFLATIYPKVLSPSGATYLTILRTLAGSGERVPFFSVDGGAAGAFFGMWCIRSINDGRGLFTPYGEAQRIDVDITIVRDGGSGAFGGLF